MEKALNEGRVLLTHDLDFAELLAASGGKAPNRISPSEHASGSRQYMPEYDHKKAYRST